MDIPAHWGCRVMKATADHRTTAIIAGNPKAWTLLLLFLLLGLSKEYLREYILPGLYELQSKLLLSPFISTIILP